MEITSISPMTEHLPILQAPFPLPYPHHPAWLPGGVMDIWGSQLSAAQEAMVRFHTEWMNAELNRVASHLYYIHQQMQTYLIPQLSPEQELALRPACLNLLRLKDLLKRTISYVPTTAALFSVDLME